VLAIIFGMGIDIAGRIERANDLIDQAIAADDGGNPSEALRLIDQASLLIAMVPDSELEDESFSWDREAIDRARKAFARRANMVGGMQTHEVRYVRESHD
jgi:hypothetical protein